MSSQPDTNNHKKLHAGLALLVLTALLTGNEFVFGNKTAANNQVASKPTPSKPVTLKTNPANAADSSSEFKNGSYSDVGMYESPGGTESISVSLTLANDKVTAASVKSGANDATASLYQSSFIGGYKKFVIGKTITSIKLSNVSGSSLTSQGFNEALKNIEQQAKA